VRSDRILTLKPKEITEELVGAKALGLLALPDQWVPPFFLVHASAVTEATHESLSKLCASALKQSPLGAEVIVRSSGVTETMTERGRLMSKVCSTAELPSVIRDLAHQVHQSTEFPIHWLVQQWCRPDRAGHLSNERRLTYDPRDWVMEVEMEGGKPGYTTRVAFRHWRDGTLLPPTSLLCRSETQIGLLLKAVSFYALGKSKRMHFEWVLSGGRLWIVQADTAEDMSGIPPATLRPASIPEIRLRDLTCFTRASASHFSQYAKLQNARIYHELGYEMPEFYILNDPLLLKSILEGEAPPRLREDLAELTKRPLILRTDGTGISVDQREMLPRSDELRSPEEAIAFLLGPFRKHIIDAGLRSAGLCLIAHHFIPSIASAWARAEPNGLMVRVESLWGLPEGLYWFSHDTFEVFIPSGEFTERRRYKGTFIGPDDTGRWVPMRTRPPADWRRSVTRVAWLREIAKTTRKVADIEGFPISLMWFVDNDNRISKHQVLPWFHSRSDLTEKPKAAPRRKLTSARDFRIETRSHWHDLLRFAAAGKHIERIVVAPVDPDLIRDQEFAEELAKLAAKHQIVVELAGGVLSHAYYVLRRHGAQVECLDLYGSGSEVREFNKLVRDKIPSSIETRGEEVEIVELRGDAFLTSLKQKIVEEAYEVLDARGGDDLIGELADVQEVVRAICGALQIPFSQVEKERKRKRRSKGGFDRGLMLRKTSTPHTLSTEEVARSELTWGNEQTRVDPPVIVRPEEIPASVPYRRPDLRNVGDQPEKLFTFETDLSRTIERPATFTTRFIMPVDRGMSRQFTLTLEFGRSRGVLRGTVRFRLEAQQLPIDLRDQLEFDFREDQSPPVGRNRRRK
jgi:predicted house-cleaning noncanonical NTP pyrophosphatase (MazG superfamily)